MPSRQKSPSPVAARDAVAKLRPWLLAGVAALLVARPLIPSESVAIEGGAPFVLLWIGLAVVWAATGAIGGKLPVRCGWIDLAALALWTCHAASALWAMAYAAPRPALNMLWEWTGMLLAYLLARQLLRNPREARALATVMVALAVGLAVFGGYDRQVVQPAVRAHYAAHPESALREAGIAPEHRKQFEDRLNSPEPLATFALTNSLAGFLTPWLIVALGALFDEARRGRRGTAVAALVCCAAIAACLFWTKSRSAYLAVAAGGLAVALGTLRPWRWLKTPRAWLIAIAIVALLAVGVAYAIAVEAVDHDLFLGARRSLEFRLEYWRATATMCADHPLLGVGPGNFQSRYTQYKLPQASEEIADPHSFAFEVAATAGLPALVALLGLLAGIGVLVWRRRDAGSGAMEATAHDPRGKTIAAARGDSDATPHVLAGGLAGIALAIPLGLVSGLLPDAELVSIVALSAVLAAFTLRDWVREGRLSAPLLVAAAGALLLNLLAAGGIGFPGVALSLWLLLALCLTAAEGFPPPLERGRAWRTAAVVEALLLAVTCYFTAYRPTLTTQGLLARAEAEPRQARELLRQAVDADPWGSEAPGRLAAVEFEVWRRNPAEDWRTFAAAAEEALARNPYSSSLWFRIGEMFAEANRLLPDEELARQAVVHFRRAAELYPTLPLAHARLSQALRAAGNEAASAESAAEALRLHDLTPHAEKKLLPELLEELGRRP